MLFLNNGKVVILIIGKVEYPALRHVYQIPDRNPLILKILIQPVQVVSVKYNGRCAKVEAPAAFGR